MFSLRLKKTFISTSEDIFCHVITTAVDVLCLTTLRTALSLLRRRPAGRVGARRPSIHPLLWFHMLAVAEWADAKLGYSLKRAEWGESCIDRQTVIVACWCACGGCGPSAASEGMPTADLSWSGPVPMLAYPRCGPPVVRLWPVAAAVDVCFRLVRCPYARLACQWAGEYSKLAAHESTCAHPHKTGLELMEPLRAIDKHKDEEVKLYKMILDLMSCEKVVITGMLLLKADFYLCALLVIIRLLGLTWMAIIDIRMPVPLHLWLTCSIWCCTTGTSTGEPA